MNFRKGIVLLLSIVLVLGIFSCSDDDNKQSYNPTDAEYIPENYAIKVAIVDNLDSDENNDFIALVLGFDETDEISIEVDGTNFLTSFSIGMHSGLVTLENSIFDFTVIVNGSKDYEFTLKNVPIPEANWPELYPIGDAVELEWTLSSDENPMYQEICYEETDNDHLFILDPSDRNFTIPAEWCNDDSDHFEIELWTVNYDVDGDMLAASLALSMGDYNSIKNFETLTGRVTDFLDKLTITR